MNTNPEDKAEAASMTPTQPRQLWLIDPLMEVEKRRVAVAEHPEDAHAHLALAEAYSLLAQYEAECGEDCLPSLGAAFAERDEAANRGWDGARARADALRAYVRERLADPEGRRSMTFETLVEIVDEAYSEAIDWPAGLVSYHLRNPDGRGGDTMAHFILRELTETCNPAACGRGQIDRAVLLLEEAADDLSGTHSLLASRLGALDPSLGTTFLAVIEMADAAYSEATGLGPGRVLDHLRGEGTDLLALAIYRELREACGDEGCGPDEIEPALRLLEAMVEDLRGTASCLEDMLH